MFHVSCFMRGFICLSTIIICLRARPEAWTTCLRHSSVLRHNGDLSSAIRTAAQSILPSPTRLLPCSCAMCSCRVLVHETYAFPTSFSCFSVKSLGPFTIRIARSQARDSPRATCGCTLMHIAQFHSAGRYYLFSLFPVILSTSTRSATSTRTTWCITPPGRFFLNQVSL